MNGSEQFLFGTRGGGSRASVHVGLVNNMPDAAMRATELQFARLLKAASGTLDVRLRLFSLGSMPRGNETRARMAGFYDDAGFLQAAQVDALIVTGAQPASQDLRDEIFWPELAHLIDWAEIGTVSTLFSCLAAHAAVLHLDGITRRALPAKLSGVYPTQRVEDDALFFGMTASAATPHSRRNDLRESDLIARGYRVLSRADTPLGSHADLFTREPAGNSHFLFLQGHPEYDAGTLGREYLRDMGRHMKGENAAPAIPENYFDPLTQDRLSALGADDGIARYGEIVHAAVPMQAWRANTVKLFANWLNGIAAAKARKLSSRAVHTRKRAS